MIPVEFTLSKAQRVVEESWYKEYTEGPWVVRVYEDHITVKQGEKSFAVNYTWGSAGNVEFAAQSEWVEVETKEVPVTSAVRSLTPTRFGGYLITWGNHEKRDLYNTYFDRDTKLHLDWYNKRPALYLHGLSPMKAQPVGIADTFESDDVGLFIEGAWDRRNKYVEYLKALVSAGVLDWSCGSAPNLIDVDKESGHVRSWPLIECTMTETPVQPRNTDVVLLQEAYRSLGLDLSAERLGLKNEPTQGVGRQQRLRQQMITFHSELLRREL